MPGTELSTLLYINSFYPYNHPMSSYYSYPILKMKELGQKAAR